MSSQIRRVLPPLLVVIACLPPSSHAAVIYLEQHRRVESAVGNNTDEFFDRRQQVAPDFAPFSGQVSSHYFDPEDFDEVTSTVTQASRLEPAGAFASGALGVAADGDFGRGSSLFSAVFDVTDSAYDFTLRYAVSTEGYNSTFRRSFHGAVSLQRLGGPGGATPVVAPAEFDLWNPQSEGPDMARDTRSGLLAPGRYALRFDLEMFATSYTDDYRATYDLALELSDTGHAGIPGDANADGTVNALDLATLRRNFGSPANDWSHGDFTGDGVVDGADFLVLRRYFGQSLDTQGLVSADDRAALVAFEAAVPDPATGSLALPAAWLFLGSRRCRRRVLPCRA